MILKRYIFFITIMAMIFSCKEKEVTKAKSTFSPQQIELINNGDSSEVMRIYLITNKEDSILLRTKSEDVKFPQDSAILAKLKFRMLATVTDSASMGVGIAAPQVGILKNMILVMRFDKDSTPFEAYYNPKVIQYTKLKQPCLEGCLSIPDRMDTTKTRAYAILLEYDKIDGSHHTEMIEDFTAVIFQHEIDHLNGILYLDHLDKEIRDAESEMKLKAHTK